MRLPPRSIFLQKTQLAIAGLPAHAPQRRTRPGISEVRGHLKNDSSSRAITCKGGWLSLAGLRTLIAVSFYRLILGGLLLSRARTTLPQFPRRQTCLSISVSHRPGAVQLGVAETRPMNVTAACALACRRGARSGDRERRRHGRRSGSSRTCRSLHAFHRRVRRGFRSPA